MSNNKEWDKGGWKFISYNRYKINKRGIIVEAKTGEEVPVFYRFEYDQGNTPFVALPDICGYKVGAGIISKKIIKPVTYFVAQAFLDRPRGKGCYIVKKDPDPLNNSASNLMYVDIFTHHKMISDFRAKLPDIFSMSDDELAEYIQTEDGAKHYKLLELARNTSEQNLEAQMSVYVFNRGMQLVEQGYKDDMFIDYDECQRMNHYFNIKRDKLLRDLHTDEIRGLKGYCAW